MKKIAIITINDLNNYGNRLQNYATQNILKKEGFIVETITNNKGLYLENIISKIKFEVGKLLKYTILKNSHRREVSFLKFNRLIKFSSEDLARISKKSRNQYTYYIVGSDQVWNPYFGRLSDIELLSFASPEKRIAFSASFGVENIPDDYKIRTKRELEKFKAISVREEAGKKIIDELLSRKDVEVLVDPTMLLTSQEWDKISKKPKMLKSKKYILNYFLGELSENRKKEIERVAKENKCDIINILDSKSPYYNCGPCEFIYLEKNAFLICTDSFHSSVFAIIYNRPFVIFSREDSEENMNSRINTLLKKLKLKNREYNGEKITLENLNHDYSEAYKILEEERKKSLGFLKKALDIEE